MKGRCRIFVVAALVVACGSGVESPQPPVAARSDLRAPVVYDKAEYHADGDFPEGLDERQAFVHTGLYLGWIIERGLHSQQFARDFGDLVRRFRARELTGPQVYEACDGVLLDEMLSDEGNAFTAAYFDFEGGDFLGDYEETLGGNLGSLYEVEDSWSNYEKLRAVLDRRFEDWRRRREGE